MDTIIMAIPLDVDIVILKTFGNLRTFIISKHFFKICLRVLMILYSSIVCNVHPITKHEERKASNMAIMTVKTKAEAWNEANKVFPTKYEKDEAASIRAGYDIYRHPAMKRYHRICDLGNCLEVFTGEYGDDPLCILIL